MLSQLLNKDSPPPPPSSSLPASPATTTNGRAASLLHSPHKSPTKRPRSPDRHVSQSPSARPSSSKRARTPAGASRHGLSQPPTPSRTPTINNLVNLSDSPPRAVTTSAPPSVTASADAHEVDALIVDDDGDEAMDEEVEEDVDVGDDEDDDEEEEEEDEEDSEEDEEDDDDDDVIALDGPDGEATGDGVTVKAEEGDVGDGEEQVKGEGSGEGTAEKGKKKRRRRSPSSDDELAPPPPPMPTIRLEVELVDSEEPLVWNFTMEAANAGYAVMAAYGEPLPEDEAMGGELDGDGAGPSTEAFPGEGPPGGDPFDDPQSAEAIAAALDAKWGDYGKKKKKKIRPNKSGRKKPRELYDIRDPFIDDSEVYIDRPTHVARPKKEGFYVHQGPLELMEEDVPSSRRQKKPRNAPKPQPEVRKTLSELLRDRYKPADAQPGEVVNVDSDDEDEQRPVRYRVRSLSPADPVPDKTDRALFRNASREEKYLPPYDQFPDEVAHALRQLRRDSLAHNWDPNNKGRFPEHLKAPLQRAGEAAFHYDMLCIADKDNTDSRYETYHEKAFVTALCSMLPYNRLTLGKLVLKLCYAEYWKWLQEAERIGLEQWREHLEPHLEQMYKDWDKAQEEYTTKKEAAEAGSAEGQEAKLEPPKKVAHWDATIKEIFKQLVENTQEMVEVNKKMEEWNQPIQGQSSELNMRKILYNKIIKLYPDDFMTSLALSRQFTNYRRAGVSAAQRREEGAAAEEAAQAAGEAEQS